MTAHSLGNIIHGATATAVVPRLYHLGVEDYGVNCLKHRNGQICSVLALSSAVIGWAKARASFLALEYTYIAFAAEEDDLLLNNCNTFKFLNISGADASLAYDFCKYLYCELIEPTVKGYGIYIYIRPQYLCTLSPDCAGALYDLLTEAGQKNSYILKAILITARVKHAVCINTYHFLCRTLSAESVIRHFYDRSFLFKSQTHDTSSLTGYAKAADLTEEGKLYI